MRRIAMGGIIMPKFRKPPRLAKNRYYAVQSHDVAGGLLWCGMAKSPRHAVRLALTERFLSLQAVDDCVECSAAVLVEGTSRPEHVDMEDEADRLMDCKDLRHQLRKVADRSRCNESLERRWRDHRKQLTA